MLASSSAVGPHINIGAGLEEAFPGSVHVRQMEASAMQEVYVHQEYWLVWRGGKGQAVLAEGFKPRDVIQILWQAGLPSVAMCWIIHLLVMATLMIQCLLLAELSLPLALSS